MKIDNEFLENYTLEGELLEIFHYPAPVLKTVAKDIVEVNDEIKSLVKNMLFTMYHAPGIGLAAPQIGKSLRIFVLDTDYEHEEHELADGEVVRTPINFAPQVFINPVIKKLDGEILYEEGCLSVPGVYEEVKRTEFIEVEYLDIEGNKKAMSADSVLSVCIQHENDHLDGIVFLERLSMLKKNILTKKYLKKQKNN